MTNEIRLKIDDIIKAEAKDNLESYIYDITFGDRAEVWIKEFISKIGNDILNTSIPYYVTLNWKEMSKSEKAYNLGSDLLMITLSAGGLVYTLKNPLQVAIWNIIISNGIKQAMELTNDISSTPGLIGGFEIYLGKKSESIKIYFDGIGEDSEKYEGTILKFKSIIIETIRDTFKLFIKEIIDALAECISMLLSNARQLISKLIGDDIETSLAYLVSDSRVNKKILANCGEYFSEYNVRENISNIFIGGLVHATMEKPSMYYEHFIEILDNLADNDSEQYKIIERIIKSDQNLLKLLIFLCADVGTPGYSSPGLLQDFFKSHNGLKRFWSNKVKHLYVTEFDRSFFGSDSVYSRWKTFDISDSKIFQQAINIHSDLKSGIVGKTSNGGNLQIGKLVSAGFDPNMVRGKAGTKLQSTTKNVDSTLQTTAKSTNLPSMGPSTVSPGYKPDFSNIYSQNKKGINYAKFKDTEIGNLLTAESKSTEGLEGYDPNEQYFNYVGKMEPPNIAIGGLDPNMRSNLNAMCYEFFKKKNSKPKLEAGFRSRATQEKLYNDFINKRGNPANKPGYSLHEYGLAVDISSSDANYLESSGLLSKWDFWRPLAPSPEAWHIQPKSLKSKVGDGQLAIKEESNKAPEAISTDTTPMVDSTLKDRIKRHEGFKPNIYKNSLGKDVIGYGFLVSAMTDAEWTMNGNNKTYMTEEIADKILDIKIANAQAIAMKTYPFLSTAPKEVKEVYTEMIHQIGSTGWSEFTKTHELVAAGKYQEAAAEILKSKWAEQMPEKSKDITKLLASAGTTGTVLDSVEMAEVSKIAPTPVLGGGLVDNAISTELNTANNSTNSIMDNVLTAALSDVYSSFKSGENIFKPSKKTKTSTEQDFYTSTFKQGTRISLDKESGRIILKTSNTTPPEIQESLDIQASEQEDKGVTPQTNEQRNSIPQAVTSSIVNEQEDKGVTPQTNEQRSSTPQAVTSSIVNEQSNIINRSNVLNVPSSISEIRKNAPQIDKSDTTLPETKDSLDVQAREQESEYIIPQINEQRSSTPQAVTSSIVNEQSNIINRSNVLNGQQNKYYNNSNMLITQGLLPLEAAKKSEGMFI